MNRMQSLIRVAAIMCALAVVAIAQHPPSLNPPPGIIGAVSQLEVLYGRSEYVNPLTNLMINVAEGDYCFVSVLPDVSSKMPGFLTPEHFPCNFGPEDVKYTHLGSKSPSEHRLRLQVRYDTSTQTYIIPVSLNVEILFIQYSIISEKHFLAVPSLLGMSDELDKNVLKFSHAPELQCQVTTNISPASLPHYGGLVNDPSQGTPVACDSFLNAGVRYQHTAATKSPNMDIIPMVVELVDARGNVVKQEYFQVNVRISDGLENSPPDLDFAAFMMMDVDQNVMTAITPELLRAQDVESNPADLVFNITRPLKPGEGGFYSTDDQNQKITNFLQADINDLRIAYKPPAEDSDEIRTFEVELQIIDTEGLLSDPFSFVIRVKPMNTLAPVVTRNTGQLLYQGQSRPLSSRQNLQISDEDNLEDVRITPISGPHHGSLTANGRKFFTAADLDAGTVIYEHDGSNTYSDNMVFRMTDGKHTVEFLFPITVATVDNTAPVLDSNTGLTVSKGATELITTWILSAADIDSEDQDINFVLEPPYSEEGQFVLISESPVGDLVSWSERGDGRWEKQVLEFTQGNLLSMEVYYRHVGSHSTEIVMDRIKFHVEDNNVPPNESPVNEFLVKILPVDNIPPRVHETASLEMNVNEFELTSFSKKSLRYTDEDTNDKDLVYTITSPPAELDGVNALENAGTLVLTEQPSKEVESFTQAEINHLKIAYQPPATELGMISRVLQFTYSVSDDAGNVLPNQVFTIFLRPVDDKPPQIVNTGFSVRERSTTGITTRILYATDEDSENDLLTFTVMKDPKRGVLYYDDRELDVGDSFTRLDIDNFHIMYSHDGDESTSDEFALDVSDGMHNIPIVVKVVVIPIDDETPEVTSQIEELAVKERGSVAITPEVIAATDDDTNDLDLTFLVTSLPSKGQITVSDEAANSFTQADIQNGLVRYVHTAGEIGAEADSDAFNLTLSDLSDDWFVGGNKVDSITMSVNILPVDSESPFVVVGDEFLVDESDRAPITTNHLTAHDEDTEDEEILCVVTSQPNEGFLENISPAPGSEKSRKGTPISSFTIGDINAENINYVQSVHSDREPIADRFSFVCQDGAPNTSPSFFFNILINAVNDEEPLLYYTEFVVEEGGELTVDLSRLDAKDGDIPEDILAFAITEKPRNGDFYRITADALVPTEMFTLNDVAAEAIVYKHDDSETTDDTFEITLTDGVHEIKQVIPITVVPVDDETPRMSVNSMLEVDINDAKTISNNHLKATDLDTDDSTLAYIISYAPLHGNITRRMPSGALNAIKIGENFTQKDIDDNRIAYIHTGQEGVRDLMKFDVTDGFNPLVDRYFYIDVKGIDTIFPGVVNKGVTLKEGGRVTLTTDILSTNDMNSADENLVFTIEHAPSRGHLETSDMPGEPIGNFTQLQLAGNKIQYVHTSLEEIKMDSFEFVVTDGVNPVYRTFRISISDVDNKKPVVTINPLVLKEGTKMLITPFELKIEDTDTPDKKLKISITQAPVHGKILVRDAPKRSFTMKDISNNLVAYQHDGTETVGDSFSFTVSDGTHNDFYVFPETIDARDSPQRVDIEIEPVDNGVPQILVNRGARSISQLASGQHGYRITKKVLRADDRDSDVDALRYVVTKPAAHGFLINKQHGETPTDNFTQSDIDNMNIFYILKTGSNATNDEFKFKIQDEGDNELEEQAFALNWACISLSSKNYTVSEEEKYLVVTLTRRGYLGETSFVSISTTNGTAKSGEDFLPTSASQVQFNPGQSERIWKVKILQDESYEEAETFTINISDPYMGILEEPKNSTVTITDAEDESTVFIPEEKYVIDENTGELLLPIERKGDLEEKLTVICYTEQATATGTAPNTVLSYSDYISRPNDQSSVITFEKDEAHQTCRVVIIDDSLYEDEENFFVKLTKPTGGRIGNHSQTEVVIQPDINDEPMFYFEFEEYTVDESDGHVEVRVWRAGTDLSHEASVTVFTRQSDSENAAVASEDYVGISETLDFAPEITMQTVKIAILDDLGSPVLEGLEDFKVVLRMPVAAMLGEPSTAVVTINDTYSDLPLMEFADEAYEVNEVDQSLVAKVKRSGDLSQSSTVRCYTRQLSAEVVIDYAERPNTDASIVRFEPGQAEGHCSVVIENDGIHEDPEEFRLVLGSPESSTAGAARIGDQDETLVTILDDADRPVIEFEKTSFEVTEPESEDDPAAVSIAVIRKGDLTQTSSVRIFTQDGNAQSGVDYNPLSKDLLFDVNVTRLVVDIAILFDEEKEIRESFTVRLAPDTNMIADLGESRAIVYINQERILADVTFPFPPSVISLHDYDDMAKAAKKPTPGYPVICVTACNEKHYNYEKVSTICSTEGIDDKQTRFRWLVAAPTSKDNVTNTLQEVAQNTFFTDSNSITLDSIYFTPGSRISCAARAVTEDGDPGKELRSEPVTVSKVGKLCPPRVAGSVGAEPFSARVRYTGASDPDHPNRIKLSVTIPHTDGMMPVISTRKLSNFEITLSRDASRIGEHKCSNILNYDEIPTQYGFLSEATRNPSAIGTPFPYQYNADTRGNNTLRFYRNLRLDACLWEFEAFYDMSELLTECGGKATTDGQILDDVHSYVSMRVPLFVSYIFHSPIGKGWQHFDQNTELQMTFVYDTAILWDDGIGSPPEAELQGHVYPTSMRINDEGKLVVNFRTTARFRGQFVLEHANSDDRSMVMSSDHPEVEMTLKLVRSEATYNEPEQVWSFMSDYAIRDYSGTYTIKLVPCTTSADQSYSYPITCNPRSPLSFDLPIRFQQVSDPVAAEFSLNTNFFLLSKRALWLSEAPLANNEDNDVAFVEGANIYGKVSVDPVYNLGSTFDASIEKVFICTGKNGYIPKYDPSNEEYGCLADAQTLLYRYKVLDKEQPDTQDETMNNVPFEAKLALDDPDALPIVQQPGTDGFRMASQPLFTVTVGREWYMHTIYTVVSKDRSRRSAKRTVHSVVSAYKEQSNQRGRRAATPDDAEGIGDDRGTNMRHLPLVRQRRDVPEEIVDTADVTPQPEPGSSSLLIIIIAIVAVLLIVGIVAGVLIAKNRGADGRGQYTGAKPVTVVGANGAGYTSVCSADSSEV